jgi:large repetitive protein
MLVLAVAMAPLSKRQVVPSRLALKVGFRPSPKAALSRVLGLALVVAGFTVLGSGQALASHLSCGDTITTNTTLDSDLVNCPNNGIVIGADNITLDLNGHTIDGDGTLVDPCPEGETCDVGVDNSAGHSGVTIEGGSIRQFALGVLVLSASRNSLRHLSVSRNLFVGIVIGESARTAVERSSITRNGVTTQQAGMVLFASRDNRIERNLFSSNGNRGLAADSADGNRINHNIFADNPEAGVAVEGDRNQVSHNRVVRNGDNIVILGDHNAITRNHVANAVGCPAEDGGIGCGFGISFEGGSYNLIASNLVARTRRVGIRVDAFANATVGNVVRANVVRAAEIDDIVVNFEHVGPVTNTLLAHNIAIGAGDDGIDVESPSTTLTRNVAVHNGDLGIEAVPGVIDGDGNHATGNGNPLQCTNVDCK